jgi:hypothetical protein
MKLDAGVRGWTAPVHQIGRRELDPMHVRVAGDLRPGVGGSRQQEPIELGPQYLVSLGAVSNALETVPCNRREFLNVSFTLCPPDGVSRRPVEVRAIDRVEDADLAEQLAGTRRQRLRRAARRVGGPRQDAH